MHLRSKKIKHAVGWGVKSFFAVALLFVVFAPFKVILNFNESAAGVQSFSVQTQVALADSEAECTARGGYWYSRNGIVGTPNCWSHNNPAATDNRILGEGTPNDNTEICHTFSGCIAAVVYVFTVGIGTVIAYIASYFFNVAVFMSLNSTAYALRFLTDGWISVRDLANMGFIFILIYIAVIVVVKAETSKMMEMLVRVVAIALIINFSFFFVRLAIDMGNVLAINFYNQILASGQTIDQSINGGREGLTPGPGGGANSGGGFVILTGSAGGAADLTAPIMRALDVQSAFNQPAFKAFQESSGSWTILITLTLMYICLGVILGLLAAMFFVIGIKFITRVVVLWVVIIASPLALLMFAVPGGRRWFDQWWQALVVYSMYPAIFLFLYTIIINFSAQTGSARDIFESINTSTATGLPFIAEIIGNISIRFGFIMVLIYMAMRASDTISSMGGQLAGRITSRSDKWAAGLARFSRAAPTFMPRYAANATYRGTVGSTAKFVDKTLKGSSLENANWWTKYYGTKFRESTVQPLAKTSIGGFMSRTDYDKTKEGSEKDLKVVAQDKQNKENSKEIETLQPALEAIKRKEEVNARNARSNKLKLTSPPLPITPLTADEYQTKARGAELRTNIKKFGRRELETFKADDIKKIVGVLSENQLKTLKDSEKYSEKEKRELETDWHKKSDASALKRSQKQIDELKEINHKLGGLGVIMTDLTRHTEPTSPTLVDTKAIETMQSEIEDKLVDARLRSRDTKASKPDRKKAGQEELQLQKAVNELKKLNDSIKEIPRALQRTPATPATATTPAIPERDAESGELVVG